MDGSSATTTLAFETLLPADAIHDVPRLDQEIQRIVEGDHADPEATRAALTAIHADAWAKGHLAISDAFRARPALAREAVAAYAYLADRIVASVVDTVSQRLFPLVTPTESEHLAVLLVGGSGRAEMAPYSDIDILFITPYKQTPWGESVIETSLYILWDLKLKVGHAVRTVSDCLAAAREDVTIRTNLLESRYLTGDAPLAETLQTRLKKELFAKTGADFVEAKLAERSERHQRQGGSRYLVEPNVKEGKGGLRDLQTLYWIGKYLYETDSAEDLVDEGIFTRDEYHRFRAAEDFLWKTRCLTHLITGRATEQLTFDVQVELAEALGYADRDGRRGVEWFMQDYFRNAKEVGELTRLFLVDLEAKHVKRRVTLTDVLRKALRFTRESLSSGYVNLNGRLGVEDAEAFLSDPVNMLRLFEEGMSSGLLIHPEAMRLIVGNLDRIDDDMRNDPVANEVFLNLLLGHNNPERPLRRMNELGVLGRFMPEFGRIDCMMQFNMYHHYTVDEHTIQAVSVLSQIENRELLEDLPLVSGILDEGKINRRVLFVATLLHDIGKGLPEDHSIAGARISEIVAPRLGLSAEEAESVVWLVRHHLLMSDVAQKRDLADPRTVRDFARVVETVERLDLLTVLTVCDIRGVGPETWNNWKAVLIRQLYALTRERLTAHSDTTDTTRDAMVARARNIFREKALHLETDAQRDEEIARHYKPFWVGLDVDTQLVLSRLSRGLTKDEIATDLEPDDTRAATRAAFAMEDHPGIFARLAGALSLVGANVKDARSYTTSDGVAVTVFWIQDAEGAPYEAARLGRLRRMIDRILSGKVIAREALAEKDVVKQRERRFQVPTEITFDNLGSEMCTIIEVDTRDRPGLLHDLTRTMKDANLSINSAIIATYGNQAVDTFYVTNLLGQKLHEKEKHDPIEAKLRDVIAAWAEGNAAA